MTIRSNFVIFFSQVSPVRLRVPAPRWGPKGRTDISIRGTRNSDDLIGPHKFV